MEADLASYSIARLSSFLEVTLVVRHEPFGNPIILLYPKSNTKIEIRP